MTSETLEPRLDLLCEEYVLVQAWKKTASYIRYHNWYSDTLELDRTAVNLPQFLAALAEQLQSPEQWQNDPLRIVPAPKSQHWWVSKTGSWEPVEKRATAARLRPLAHVSLKDQVAATALMLCLADRVESLQGDPRTSIKDAESRKRVISYGNRLFCDAIKGELRHRWGSTKLYRAYYQDYRMFLSRPEVVADTASEHDGARIVIVHSDLRQFYDRVRPALLAEKIIALKRSEDDSDFYAFAERLLNWRWDRRDAREVDGYARQAELADFSYVALPQGLVASGFFANVVLLDFDRSLRDALSQEIVPGIRMEDACRYVDDLRIVLAVDQSNELAEIEDAVVAWLKGLLDQDAPGLEPSEEKTIAAAYRSDKRPLVRQSRKMLRIQSAVSGGFDAIAGEEILDAIRGLIRSQQRFSEKYADDVAWRFSPVPDVRDVTVARFAAGRFRTTYRSLRPLLEDRPDARSSVSEDVWESEAHRSRVTRTQTDLDDDARDFALGLIERWIQDPSNVRLLRIGLDLWPDEDVLKSVLELLRPFTEKGGRRKAPRRVAWYCLSEILRVGATETGFVEDDESLPAGIDLNAYRSVLRKEAVRLASLSAATIPWYLRQQALLFLAATDPAQAPVVRTGRSKEIRHYRELIRFLKGEGDRLKGADFATLAILSRRSFRGRDAALRLAKRGLTPRRLEEIAHRDPSFALEILGNDFAQAESLSPRLRNDLCMVSRTEHDGWEPLRDVVMQGGPSARLRNELSLLQFATKFLEAWGGVGRKTEDITPCDVWLKFSNESGDIGAVDKVRIVPSRVAPVGSMYCPPQWCDPDDRWRFQLGYLLRFILAGRPDYTMAVRPAHWKDDAPTYKSAASHWYQRLYGLFNAQQAFGDDWLPISDWVERLLSALLHWPGCRTPDMVQWVSGGIDETRRQIEMRVAKLGEKRGPSSGVLLLPLIAPFPVNHPTHRPLRACVVQTTVPTPDDFDSEDLTLSNPAIRKRHRNHLSTALAAIKRMLDLRETHKGRDGRLDWLILPELAVHPRDIRTHLLPFARAHKTIILTGLTYEEVIADQPLVNSAI